MPLIDTPMLRALGRFLDVNAFRETLVASNMANIDMHQRSPESR